jgi:signal transduction histidine kinase
MHERQRQVALNLGLAAAYLLAAKLGMTFDPMAGFATLVWPPTGIALAAILLLGKRVAPGIFLGALGANMLVGASLPVGVGIAVGNTCEALMAAAILRRVPSFSITLEGVTSVIALIVGAAMLSTAVSATVGVLSLHLGGIVQSSEIRDTWRAWWVGDMVGALLLAPLILVWKTTPRAHREVHPVETVALVASLAVVSGLTFFDDLLHVPPLAAPFHQADLLVVLLLWAAIRFGQRGATTSVLCASVTATVATALRHGPFVRPELNDGLMLLQMFIAIVAATCLLFSAAIAERRIADQQMRSAQLQAEAANSAKSQFLRVMSHELRTPLNAIQGFAELLETGVYGPLNEKQADALQRIERNEKDLLALINEMLGFVDAEKAPALPETKDVQVADAFDVVEPLISKDVERKHLVMKRELARPGLAVRADPKGLQQILASLLSNACKYTGEGGTITLGADAAGQKVRIWVRDTGVGIKKEEMERVFEPFFQAESGTTRRYSGVGLGLTIARNLAQRMSGEVTIASEEGKGTTASVFLPVGSAKVREDDEEEPALEVA